MARALRTPAQSDQKVVLRNVDWETYDRLVTARKGTGVPRITYDRGDLEIMSPSAEHEAIKDIVALLINVWAEELEIDLCSYGSTTFRREDLGRAFEPDTCFYINSVEQIRGRTRIDLAVDPPPDLIVEVDISGSSIDKLEVFAQLKVPEVWRFDGERFAILTLRGNEYVEQGESRVLSGLPAALVTEFLENARTLARPEWLRQLRRRIRERKP